jgi:ribosomal protein S18 acetylase RimI-like enzyme
LELNDRAVGVAILEETPDHLMIYSIAVRPETQRKGLGAALLGFAEKRATAIELAELRLYTNARMEHNISLYRRRGFVEAGRHPHPSRPGDILIDMVKRLPVQP